MIYRTNIRNKEQLSQLAFGCMRFDRDDKEVERQLSYAIENGVNYFDTAYAYPKNEERLGRALQKLGLRQKVNIATKMPTYLITKTEGFNQMFNTQLKRLQTDYIDYYLMHMIPDVNEWERACNLGILDFINEKKESGQIRNLGFSYHGGLKEFKELVDVYEWDFCMIQFNYLDENNQAGIAGLEYAASKGLPVFIMEPLRGGKLANKLPKEALKIFEKAPIKRSPAEWALRWVWNHPAVVTVLSGMNTMEMLEENIRIASEAKPNELTQDDFAMFEGVRKLILGNGTVPCTGCGYCMPCPKGVDIPMCFTCYNDKKSGIESGIKSQYFYIQRTHNHQASLCVECGKCEKHCPQNIAIREELKKVKKELEGPIYRPARFIAKKIMKRR
ncbi:MAG: aldo/keto reductase [Firmicutes bacterium]|nr:aldo/keto reductase [Bacillota bacterium]